MTTLLPVPVRVTRYRCPLCGRGHGKKTACTAHIARCWQNPAARTCKTCVHFESDPGGPPCVPGRRCSCNEGFEQCAVKVDITGGLKNDCPQWAAAAGQVGGTA